MITALDHIQLALPAGAEDKMRAFYCGVLDMVEVAKPAPLQGRGGFWAQAGSLACHFGVDPDFHPATKAHPAFVVKDLRGLANRIAKAGHDVIWDSALPDVARFFTADPAGNRLEFIGQS